MYPDGYPHNLGGYGWIWIIIAEIHFSSIYHMVLSVIPEWFRDHVDLYGVYLCACRDKWRGLVVMVSHSPDHVGGGNLFT